MTVHIMLADDHAVFRNGLKALLEKEKDILVSAETGNGADTLATLKKQKVDVLILDLKMPGMPSDKLAETILQTHPKLPIIILTMHEDEFYLKQFFKIGVKAFVLKKSAFTDVLQAIRAVLRGEVYVDPAMAGPMVRSFVHPSAGRKTVAPLTPLSDREKEVCGLLAYGFTNQEISEKLFISIRTVETHRTNIMEKLELKSRAELVQYAIQKGLVRFG